MVYATPWNYGEWDIGGGKMIKGKAYSLTI